MGIGKGKNANDNRLAEKKSIEQKDEEIAQLKAKPKTVDTMVPQLMQCRAPPCVYSLCLKEQHISFRMMRIVRDLSPSLQTSEEFYSAYQTSPTAIKNLLCEFYVHNYVVLNDVDWNALLYIRDIQLRALMSWMWNEIARGEQFQVHKKEELDLSLTLKDCI